jgi:hypothetical protein
MDFSTLLPARSVAITFDQQQPTTVDILSNTSITTTIYDAQATDGGNADADADADITYSIKGVNADKFSITTER